MRKIWKILAVIAVVALFLGGRSVVPVAATPDVTVSIDAPATAAADSDFTANVNITEVTDFDACNYDVSFNALVLRLDSVTSGLIDSTPVPIDIANELSPGTWTVVQNVSGLAGVDGSGYLAVLHFHVVGTGSSPISLSNGMLSNNLAEEIPATWVGDTVIVPGADTTPPTVSSVSPAADATDVAISTTVSVTFSEAMDESTITTSSFTLGGVSGSVSYNSGTDTATFTPSADLSYDTTYTANLSTAITDAAGNPLASAYSWSFTTVAEVVVTVSIDAPATAAADSDFTANVNITEVTDFDACNYDVSFDASVLRLDSVTAGLIDSTPVPVDIANELSAGTWTVVQNVSGLAGVSGSGYLAVLHFHVIGSDGDTSAISLSNGMLSNNLAEEIAATWVGDSVIIGPGADVTPPTVSSVSPAADATGVAISTTVNVTFSEAMDESTITTSSFTLGGVSGSVSYNSGTDTATFTPGADLSYDTTYTANLSTAITDAAGNPLASAYSWSFTTTSAPVGVTVSIDAPATAAADSDFTANVNITEVTNFDACNYDVSFDASVLRLDSVTSGLIGSTPVPVDIANELSPGIWTVVQNISGLAGVSGSGYLAVLHFHVIGSDGDTSAINLSNGMLSNNVAEEIPATWVGDSVIIGPAADTTPPTVSSVSPASGATGVAVTTTVTATFSEAMNASTITTSSFTVGGVSGSVSYNSGTYTATFAPSSNLSYSTTYTANLSTAITDAAGNPLASAYSWSFTTASAPVGVTVSIDAPAAAAADSDFTANVNISQVTNFDACNYNVSFDASVLRLDSVTSGLIGSTPVPVDIANELSPGMWTVVQNISGLAGVSGSGYLAVLHFHVIGAAGTSSAINLSNGMLSNNVAEEIPATWVGDSVNVVGVDTTPPTVVSTSPASGATGVAITTTVTATFSEAMNASTITTSSFTVGGVSGSVSYNSGTYTATFTPGANLSYSTTYTANLSTAITDAAGNPLASAYSWSFTTSASPSPPPGGGGGGGGLPPDLTPPRISEVSATSITETTADIAWRTHEKGDSQVEFWASPSNFSLLDPELVIEHLVHLTYLTPATMYHYRVMSKDRAGNQTVSDEYIFVTLGKPPAAAFTSSNLIISPSQVDVGEPVAISVSITNAGNATGSYEVTLKINGVVEATEEVALGAGTSQEVTFTTARDMAGTYTVEVDGLSGSFTVKEKPAPPAPPSAPTPTPPAPPAPAPPAPTPPPSAVNWPLIGGIIGGVAAGIAISLVVRRRRAKA